MPKIVDHDKYRGELLEKSIQLFSQRGFGAVSMREIARELGISTGALYHYFPSKESIFEQMFLYMNEQMSQKIDEFKTTAGSQKISAAITFLQQQQHFFTNRLFLIFDYYQRRPQASECVQLTDIFQQYRKKLATLFDLSADDAVVVTTLIDGFLVQRLLDNRSTDWGQLGHLLESSFKNLSTMPRVAVIQIEPKKEPAPKSVETVVAINEPTKLQKTAKTSSKPVNPDDKTADLFASKEPVKSPENSDSKKKTKTKPSQESFSFL
jgi:AcrR family transcriptional regulator